MNIENYKKYDQSELIDFAANAKFKTAKSTLYNYFNIDSEYQVRIYKGEDKRHRRYHVTLHKISDDGITYGDYVGIKLTCSYKEAKIEAAKFYFNQIRL
jgi:subtilase family serine protease